MSIKIYCDIFSFQEELENRKIKPKLIGCTQIILSKLVKNKNELVFSGRVKTLDLQQAFKVGDTTNVTRILNELKSSKILLDYEYLSCKTDEKGHVFLEINIDFMEYFI